jgi:hypothetical protein
MTTLKQVLDNFRNEPISGLGMQCSENSMPAANSLQGVYS